MNVKFIIPLLLALFASVFSACQSSQTAGNQASNDTPTEAYKRLYAAVKSKNTESIKKEMSKTTQDFAAAMQQMRKQTDEETYRNGFFESLMSPAFPQLRDERVNDNFGAVEAQKPSGDWEDVPFVKEDGRWKLAVGDVFKNTYKSPGAPASRANAPQQMPDLNTTNADQSVNIAPSKNASQNANVATVPKAKTAKEQSGNNSQASSGKSNQKQ